MIPALSCGGAIVRTALVRKDFAKSIPIRQRWFSGNGSGQAAGIGGALQNRSERRRLQRMRPHRVPVCGPGANPAGTHPVPTQPLQISRCSDAGLWMSGTSRSLRSEPKVPAAMVRIDFANPVDLYYVVNGSIIQTRNQHFHEGAIDWLPMKKARARRCFAGSCWRI
jgi:hypothetical protein